MKLNTSHKTLSQVIASVIAAQACVFSNVAFSEGFLEEVVVTAQKRQESVQDVPVAVTAFDSNTLEKTGVLDITELQKVSPNTTLQTSRGTNSTLTAFIRGVGQEDPLWGFEPGVGLYVDDIYFARPQAGVLDVYDVERIEVLRGPQGTLYGKNTIGGAVKYVTKRLTGEPELTVSSTIGSYNQRDITIAGQLPLVEDLVTVGGSIASLNRDGFGEFLLNGDENYNKDILAGRVSVEVTPSESLLIRFAADFTDDDSNAKGGSRLTQSLLVPDEPIPGSVFDSFADLDTDNNVESSGASVTVQWDVNDSVTLKSITGYREGETQTNIDFDNTSFASLHVPAEYDDDQFTQEFQFNYTSDNFHLVSGLYYYEGTASGAFDVLLGAFDTPDLFGDGSNVAANFDAVTAGSVDTESYALYAHATFDINYRLSVTAGARYTRDEKEADVFNATLFADGRSSELGGEDLLILGVNTDYTNDDTWNEFSPRLSVDYRFTDAVLGYVSYSHGFKSGGFDMRGNARLNPDTVNGYDPEIVDTYEIGLKSEWFNNRLRVNAAAYYTDYDDLQVTVQTAASNGTTFVSEVVNAGKAFVEGAELEVTAQLSNSFSLIASAGYTNAEFTEVITDGPDGPVDVSDFWGFAFTPDWTTHLAVNYFTDLDQLGTLNVNVSSAYRSSTRIFPQVESLVDQKGYSLWDASIVWNSVDDHWSVGLHGKNLTDEEYRVGGYNFIGLGLEDSIIGYYGNPRTVSLNVNYRL
ncbi:TonB-dependent receptor [Sessilibacter corallicola]|uniref:TonB-dependent receptor n=1 Tax=Sessilibacter corallicola TaxID=2904075 RepID=A0ABQ0A5I0_9GAMM|nr:TonB-dependent receptor [Sessilibacter corallicola]MCE2027689.1 TonB-dependent receptor [Sessilibacter corallicola]